MNAYANPWYQMAVEAESPAELRAMLEPHLALIVRRAVEGAPGTLAERIRTDVLDAGDHPSPRTATRRLAANTTLQLLANRPRIVTRDTIVLTDTLAG